MPATHFVATSPSTFKHSTTIVPGLPRTRPIARTTRTAVVTRAAMWDGKAAIDIGALTRAPATWQALQHATPTAWRAAGAQITRWVGPQTLVGSHPFLSTAGGVMGAVASLALINQVYEKLSPEQQAKITESLNRLARGIEHVAPYAVSLVLGAASGTLGQEGAVRWTEARHLTATLMLAASVPLGLASLETIAKEFDIPIVRRALSGPLNFLARHGGDVSGALLGAAGISSARVATAMIAANNPWGWALMAGAMPAVLGGAELVGREHDIPGVRECLTGPVEWTVERVRRLVSKEFALHAVGAALSAAGTWGVVAGLLRLGVPTSSPGDAIGAAQITAGTLAAGLGAGIWAKQRNQISSAEQLLKDYSDGIEGAMMAAWGAALGKFAVFNIMAFGPAYLNTAAGAIALGLMSLGSVAGRAQTLRHRKADGEGMAPLDPEVSQRLQATTDRAWWLYGSMGSAAWTILMARGLLHGAHGSALLTAANAVPQLGASAVLGAISVGALGQAMGNEKLKRISADIGDNVSKNVERAFAFAVDHPAPTLAGLGALLLLAKQAM